MEGTEVNADNIITLQEWIFLIFFIVLVFGVPSLVAWLSYSEKFKRFDLRSLWEHKERKDKLAVILMGTWWLHSCSMVMWTLLRTVTTADWTTYQLWALPIIAKMLNDAWAPKNGNETKTGG